MITDNTYYKLASYVANVGKSELKNLEGTIRRQIIPRIASPVMALFAPIPLALDFTAGVIASPLAFLCMGKNQYINVQVAKQLANSSYLFSSSYFHLLRTINPKLQVKHQSQVKIPLIDQLAAKITDLNISLIENSNPERVKYEHESVRNLVSRGIVIKAAVYRLVHIVARGVIGIPALLIAPLTLGCYPKVNTLAAGTLHAPGQIILKTYVCMLRLLNPNAPVESI